MKPSEMFLKNKHSTRVARKKPLLSVEKRIRFASEHLSLPPEYWNDAFISDDTQIMYYHDGPQRDWRKPLTALETKFLFL